MKQIKLLLLGCVLFAQGVFGAQTSRVARVLPGTAQASFFIEFVKYSARHQVFYSVQELEKLQADICKYAVFLKTLVLTRLFETPADRKEEYLIKALYGSYPRNCPAELVKPLCSFILQIMRSSIEQYEKQIPAGLQGVLRYCGI